MFNNSSSSCVNCRACSVACETWFFSASSPALSHAATERTAASLIERIPQRLRSERIVVTKALLGVAHLLFELFQLARQISLACGYLFQIRLLLRPPGP